MKKFAVFALIAAVLVGCADRRIYNVENHPIPFAAQNLPLDRIETVIIQTGSVRDWQFQRAGAGHLVATLSESERSATVDIYFDQRSFRILKQSTTGLREKNGTIGPRYNFWIRNLEADINSNLTSAGLMPAT